MKSNHSFGVKSAYGQLILLVFLPIVILSFVGSYIVLNETRRAVLSEQDVLAQAALVRYEPLIRPMLADMQAGQDKLDAEVQRIDDQAAFAAIVPGAEQVQSHWFTRFQQFSSQHVLRMAVLKPTGQVLFATGVQLSEPWADFNHEASQVSRLPTPVGTAYGAPIDYQGKRYWLMVDMDDKLLSIAYYRVMLALTVTGLATILLLLLILNIYAKRWITPIYEMRLFLQKLNAHNLSQVPTLRTDGEFALLQNDFIRAIKRLDHSFTELQAHAKETEQDLQEAFDEMEMQNISIREARDQAVSASQAKSAFLANISHELRTPLNSIDGFINLLARKAGLSHEQELYVQTIKKSSAHLLAVVNDVLDFSKMEAGKLALDSHDFDLYTAVYDVVDMLSPAALEKRLRLSVLYYHDVPTAVVGDSLRVKQILTNLVGNAIKFTDAGSVVVRVTLAERAQMLRIEVEDTGRGISEKDKRQLFQSFSQGDLSVTRRYGGTGLGLVISKQLTHLMGGSIGFFDNHSENISNSGATFWFEMPMGANTAEPALPMLSTARPLRLLAWLNHLPALQVLKASLSHAASTAPIEIHEAIGLADLLDKLDSGQTNYDWVLVDYFGQDAAKDDIESILRQIRTRYTGKLASYGYQVGMDGDLLGRYQTYALYEPMDSRQLYALLMNQTAVGSQNSPVKFDGTTVMIVDDHQPNLLVLEALLSELGAAVVTAHSGLEAIEKMTESVTGSGVAIDLIFMDVQMPRMSGLEASVQIRKIEQAHLSKAVPIIALTAHGMSDEKDRLVAAGLDDYAGKPIGQARLIQMLQKWLGGTSPAITAPIVENNQRQYQTAVAAPEPLNELNVNAGGETQGIMQPQTDEQALPADIDWADAVARAGDKADLALTLLTMLIDAAEQDKQQLEQAWANRERETLASLAHRMVGAARYTGVPRLRLAAERFEALCQADMDNISASQFVAMRPAYRALIDALDALQSVDLAAILAKHDT